MTKDCSAILTRVSEPTIFSFALAPARSESDAPAQVLPRGETKAEAQVLLRGESKAPLRGE